MANNTIGVNLKLEGEKEYISALKNINTEQKELRSELALSASEFEGQQNSMEALTAKVEIMQQQYDTQAEKVSVYCEALQAAQLVEEKAAENVSNLKEQLEQAQAKMQEMGESSEYTEEEMKAQAQAVEELKEKLASAESGYEKAEAQTSKWQTSLNFAQADLNKLGFELEKQRGYLEEAAKSTDGCAHSIDEYGKAVKEAEESNNSFWNNAGAVAAGSLLAEAFKNLCSLAKEAGEELINLGIQAAYQADNINTLSVQTGISTETIQKFMYAEQLMDVSLSTVTGALSRNIRAMSQAQQGTENYAEAYQKIGIEVANANGSLRDSEEVFWEVIDALGKVENASERDAIAMQLFGRGARELNPLIKIGAEGFKALGDEAEKVGYVLDQNTLDALNKTSDSLERASKKVDAIKTRIGAEMAPAITSAVETLTQALEDNEAELTALLNGAIKLLTDALQWIIENAPTIISFITAIGAGFMAYKASAAAISLVNAALSLQAVLTGEVTAAQVGLNAAMSANPIGLLIAAFAGLAAGLTAYNALTGNAISETQALCEETKKLAAENENAARTRETDRQALETQGREAEKLVKRLEELSNKTVQTTEEQAEMTQIVSTLNATYPGLNAELSNNSGQLSVNTAELWKNVKALQAQAMAAGAQAQLTELSKKLVEAKVNNDKLTKSIGESNRELKAAQKGTAESSNIVTRMLSAQNGQLWAHNEAVREATEKNNELISAYKDNLNLQKNLQSEIDTVSEMYLKESQNVEKAKTANDELNNTLSEQAERISGGGGGGGGKSKTVVEAVDEAAEANQRLAEAYEQARQSAVDSVESQAGLFGELSNKSDLTTKEMAVNLDKNAEVLNQYAADVVRCKELVDAGLLDEGILGAIKEMGLSGAGYMHELANASDTEIGNLVASYNKMEDGKRIVENVLTAINFQYSDAMKGMTTQTDDSLSTMGDITRTAVSDTAAAVEEESPKIVEATDAWTTEVKGITDLHNQMMVSEQQITSANITEAIKTETPLTVEAQQILLDDVKKMTDNKLGWDGSKSSVYTDIGGGIPTSLADGVRSKASDFYRAVEEMFDEMTEKAIRKAEKAAKAIDRALGGKT